METANGGGAPPSGRAGIDPSAQLVYVVAQNTSAVRADDELDFFKLWSLLWHGRWLIIGITAAFALGSAVYASLLPRMYTARVVLSPVKDEPLSGLASQLGGLASLAGIASVGTDNSDSLAVLKSRDFVREFIEAYDLLPLLYADRWDAAAARWTVDPPPTPVQGAGFFVGEIRTIEEDARSGLVTLSVEWTDPALAARWANQLAAQLNDHMRQRALAEAEANVKYLRGEFETTSIVALQQSISDLLENEMQKLMLARGNSEYAFRIIDRAEVPTTPSKPRVTFLVVIATAFGAMLAVFVVLIRSVIRNRASAMSQTAASPNP
jgi:uncharacterized protein involved in exopolysaccharide biosynthesis